MLDYRAWIISGVLLVAALGAYLVWVSRPRLNASVRSLSAAPSSKISQTKSLHVDGCTDDFIVQPGELVEPRVVPGASVEQVSSLYGHEPNIPLPIRKETALRTGKFNWDETAFLLTDGWFGPDDSRNYLQISLQTGHVLETLDGIELGIDSFGTIFRKMGRDRKVETHERLVHGDGSWTLVVSFYSACGHKFRSEYLRTFAQTPEMDRLIMTQATKSDGRGVAGMGSNSGNGLLRSDTFMNKIVSEYRMVPSLGKDTGSEGTQSEHE